MRTEFYGKQDFLTIIGSSGQRVKPDHGSLTVDTGGLPVYYTSNFQNSPSVAPLRKNAVVSVSIRAIFYNYDLPEFLQPGCSVHVYVYPFQEDPLAISGIIKSAAVITDMDYGAGRETVVSLDISSSGAPRLLTAIDRLRDFCDEALPGDSPAGSS